MSSKESEKESSESSSGSADSAGVWREIQETFGIKVADLDKF